MAKSYKEIISSVKPKEPRKKRTYQEILKSNDYTFDVDKSYIESFINDSANYFTNATKDSEEVNFNNASSHYSSKQTDWSALNDKAKTLRAYYNANKDKMDSEGYKGMMEYLDNFDKGSKDVLNFYRSKADNYSKFETEAEYNDAVKVGELYEMPSADILPHLDDSRIDAKKAPLISRQTELQKQIRELGASGNKGVGAEKKLALQQELNDVNKQIRSLDETIEKSKIAYTTSSGQNITWANLYEKKKAEEDFNAFYDSISSTDDWQEGIKKGKEYQNPSSNEAEHKVIFAGKGILGGTDSPINKVTYYEKNRDGILFGYMNGGGSSIVHPSIEFMKDKEKEIYNYYFGKGEYDKAEEYYKSLEPILIDRFENKEVEAMVSMAEEHPIIASGLSVGFNLFSGAEFIKDSIDYAKTGELDTNHAAELSSAIRSTVSSKFDVEVGDWDAFDFVYNTGMSMADSLVSQGLYGKAGGVMLGLSAAAQGTNDALDRGMSKGQAFASGVASGIFEGIFETWSIGAFSDLTKNLKRADFRNLAKYVGKNMWNNAKEETLTEIANIAYDYLVNGDFSQYETAIRQYMNSGLSETDAKWKVASELGVQVAEAAGSGALMGFGFGAGGSVGTVSKTIQSGKAIKDAGETRNLVDLGKSLGEGTESYNLANKITDKSRAFAIGQLLGIAADEINNANRGDIIKSLERKGYSTEVANSLADMMLDPENTLFKDSPKYFTSAPNKTYSDIVSNPNSTVGQRNAKMDDILRGIAENRDKKAQSKKTESVVEKKQGFAPLAQNYVETRAKALASTGIPMEQAMLIAQREFEENQSKSPFKTESTVESKFESNPEGKDFDTASGRIIASKKLVSSEKDKMAFEVTYDDGATDTVSANDISFGNEGEALVYSTVMDMNVPVGVAEALIGGYKGNDINSAATYVNGIREAFTFGKYNQEADLNKGGYASKLTDEQRNSAFKLGRIYANEKAITDLKNIVGDSKPNVKKLDGKLHFEGDKLALTSVQDSSVESLKVLTMAIGKDIHIYESYVENGRRVYKDANGNVKSAPNGFYDPKDSSIWIDLNAGNLGQGTMMYTVAHELTHFIKQWSPTKFKALADFLVEKYGEKGVSVHELVLKQQAKAKEHNRKISYDVAFEEMVADSMEAMLTDGKVIRELAHKDKGLFNKIKSWIDNLLRKLNKAYKEYTPESEEGQTLLKMKETFEEVQKLFAEALVDASDNFAIKGSDKAFIEEYLKTHDLVYNLRAKESHQAKLAEKYSTSAAIDLETLQKRYDKILGIWEKLGGELNSKFLNEWNNKQGKDRAFTVFKAQAGYKYNIELSSMCKKGVPLFEAIDTIVKKEVMKELNTDTIGKAEKEILYDILKEHNFEIPCAICYVEQARQREGVIIKDFLDGKIEKNSKGKITKYKLGWNDVLNKVEKEMKKNGVDYTFHNVDKSIATDSYAPADIVMDEATQDVFYKALKKVANAEIVRWNREERKSNQKERRQITDLKPQTIKEVFKGTLPSNLKIFKVLFNNPSSRFKISNELLYSSATTLNLANAHNDLYSLFNSQGGVAGYKTKQAPIVYWGDILGKNYAPSTVRKEGGIRNQSNSDFQMYTLLDQAQMYIDFSAKGYYLQAYTKVLAELKLFGLSRGKINASLIPRVIEYRNADGTINWEKTKENAGLDENGNPIYDDFEGINHKEAFMLIEDAEYSKNICGICIGYSDNHIRKLLDDNRVQQIIGFHDKTDNPDKRYRGAKYAKNYNGLNEAVKIKADGTEETVHIGFNQYVMKAEKMFKFDKKTETYSGTVNYNGKTYVANDIPRLATDLYLEMCAEKNYRPAYDDFKGHKNYYKLLADFGLYDSQGNYAPHQKVQYNMPDQVPYIDAKGNKAYMKTEDYIKAELEKELTVRDSIAEALADTSKDGIIPQFVERVNELHSTEADTTLHSDRDYSYDVLVSKPDMPITFVDDKATYEPTSTTRKNLVNQAIKNATSFGKNENGRVEIYVDDIDTYVTLSKKSLVHGIDRRLEISAPVILNIGSVIKNSIRINELIPKKQSASGAYVLIGYAESTDYVYPVRMVVNQYTNEVDTIDVLYAVNVKKETVGKMPGSHSNAALPTVSTISISNLLDFVNKYFPDMLPESVWKHYGHTERPEGDLGKSVLYSERDTDSVSTRSLLANALEGAAQNDIEKNKLTQYKEKIALIEAEQNKLHELREKLFTKGIKGDERREIQEEATRTANRINTYDRQLFNLEATTALKNVLNREKELARKRQKQKDAENLKAYKEKVAETTRQLLDKNMESRERAIEGRNKTEMRHKVKKIVNDLNNLLLKPSKERHVPEELRVAVAEALDIVNMDTVDADTRVARLNALIAKSNDPDEIASFTESRDRILEQGNKLGEKLDKLKSAYDTIRKSTDDSTNSFYDDVIYSKIESVQEMVGKTPLRNMTLEQLENVYELYKMVLTTVRDSNKAFAEDLKMTRQALGSNTFAEIKNNNKKRDTIKHAGFERGMWKNLKPMQAMKTIGSSILQKLWNNVLYGQEVFAQDYDEAVKFAKDMKEKYGYKKWDLNKLYSFESKSGKVMKINLEQMMSIYAYSKRAQADEHIEYGGIVLNEGIIKEKGKLGKIKEVKVNDSTAYRLDKFQVGRIIATLEKEYPGAKGFVDEMQKYLSETMGAKGNEVSMKMYGIKLFKEEHYFPLKSSKEFMESANAKLKGDVKIKNKGMTKSTVEHARNPIVLENFLDVWGNHINEMAMYHGLVLPLEDFSRTLNYGFKADEKANTDAESVKTAMHDAFGDSAEDYLNELLKAINGGVLHDSTSTIADKMISRFKKSKVMASLSVIIQQPTAIIRAMGIIEPKYFTSQNFKHKETWEELKKYCPTAIIKETGSFDTNMGRTIVDMIKEDQSFTEKVGDTLGKAPAWMDEMGWNMIWRALKNKVATEQNLLGEALLKECGKQMTLIINETQVYDSVMSRNELMRSKSVFTKMATAFMGEPTTVANMIYGAALDFKRGKKSVARKTVAAVISSVVINGLVSSLVYAFRDDDEEKTWLEKYLSSATTEVLDGLNPLTYIPFVKDVYSLLQGYDVERTDLALFGDVVDALEDFYNVIDPEAYEDMSGGEIAKHIYENAKPLLTSICDMFGLPVGNILRDVEAIIINDNLSMSKTSGEGIGLAFKDGWLAASPKLVEKFFGDEKYHKLYLKANNGDTAYVKTEVAEMIQDKVDSGKTEKEAKSSVRSSFTSTYRDEYLKANSEERNRIRKFLYATGLWNSLSELDKLLEKWREED